MSIRFLRDSAPKVMSYKKVILFLLLLIVLEVSGFPRLLWPITWILAFMRFRYVTCAVKDIVPEGEGTEWPNSCLDKLMICYVQL